EGVRLAARATPPTIDEVAVDATRFVSPERIRGAVSQKEGEPLDTVRLADDLVREFSRGDLRFGGNLTSDFRSESTYSLRALFRSTWINPLGGEWLLGAQIGTEQGIATEFYQPVDIHQSWFLRPFAATSLTRMPLFFEGDRVAVFRVQENRAGLDAGANIGVVGQVRAGWAERRLGAVLDTGPDAFLNLTTRVGGPEAAA